MAKLNRLYENFRPSNYNLSLDLKRLTRKFSGKVIIVGELTKLDSPIKLHAKELKITGALINDIPADTEKGENDELTIIPSSTLINKNIVITLTFSGEITDSMHGIYPCYFDHSGQKRELLMTQFEAFHAHEVFPCVDEPEAKATFDLTLETEDEVEVLSNMPVSRQTEEKDRLITSFQTSPVMSTYLLAFVVGKLHKISKKTKDGLEVNAWATYAQTDESMKFALDTAVSTIEFFTDYFDTPYPLPKLDHVAVPDFSSAAMENWGLITYRESHFITDKTTAVSTRQIIAGTIAHENSHQWFGNLVTMSWWDDLWLNESFANMMAYVALDELFPQWKVWNEFASHESLAAMRRDSLSGVQPIRVEVNHPSEIGALFDPLIVYAKGGNLLNMLRQYIGDESFTKALKAYFKKHAYNNTTGDDLWLEMGKTSEQNIGEFMSQWLGQSGFPVINLKINKDKLDISQHHFLVGAKSDERMWPVPLFPNNSSIPKLLSERSLDIKMPDDWVLLNKNDASYFITNYNGELQNRLIKNISSLSDIDRLKLLGDAGLLSRGLIKPASELIDLLKAFDNETAQPVWSLISLTITDLRRFTENSEQDEINLRKFTLNLCRNLYEKLGWQMQKNEAEETTILRSIIVGLMIYAEHLDAVETAIDKYNQVKGELERLDGELRTSILVANVRYSNNPTTVIEDLLNYHDTTNSSDLRQDICAALTGTKDVEMGKKYLLLMTDSNKIRPQDVPTWFVYMIRNRYLRSITWQWLIDNWGWVKNTYGNDHHYDVFAHYSASAFSTTEYEQKYRDFFVPKLNEKALKRTIEIGITEISARIQWIQRNHATTVEKLRNINL